MYSISRIKLFKACRRAYELKYIEGLEPVQTADALQVGANYHEKLEELYKTGDFDASDLSRESAMALAYKKYIYPKFKVCQVEDWEKITLDGEMFVGRPDAISEDGKLVEHKTTGYDLTEYEYGLQWDEQILTYMAMTGTREVYFTVCRKPTIRQGKKESDEEFFNRMVDWYDVDTDSKIKVITLSRTDEEVEDHLKSMKDIIAEIKYCKTTGRYYRNTNHCKCWGRRCEYSSVCLNYDPNQEYVEFIKGDRYVPEI